MGFSSETLASVVLHTWLEADGGRPKASRVSEPEFKNRVSQCIECLIDSATTDAILRLNTVHGMPLEYVKLIERVYWQEQGHRDLADYLKRRLGRMCTDVFLQVTTYSRLLSLAESDRDEFKRMLTEGSPNLDVHVSLHFLQAFDTILDFENAVRSFMMEARKKPQTEHDTPLKHVLIIQVNRGYLNQELLLCAQLKIQDIYNELSKSSADDPNAQVTQQQAAARSFAVVCVVQIQRMAGGNFNGYQCGFWHCVHIDDLVREGEASMLVDLQLIKGKSISQLFRGEDVLANMPDSGTQSDDINNYMAIYKLLVSCIPNAVSLLKFTEHGKERATQLIRRLKTLFTEEENSPLRILIARTYLQRNFRRKIGELFAEREKQIGEGADRDQWLCCEAASADAILNNATLSQSVVTLLKQRTAPMLASVLAYCDTNHNLDSLAYIADADAPQPDGGSPQTTIWEQFCTDLWSRLPSWQEVFDLTFGEALQRVRCGTGLTCASHANDVCFATEVDVQYVGFHARSWAQLALLDTGSKPIAKRLPFAFIVLQTTEKIMMTVRNQLTKDDLVIGIGDVDRAEKGAANSTDLLRVFRTLIETAEAFSDGENLQSNSRMCRSGRRKRTRATHGRYRRWLPD